MPEVRKLGTGGDLLQDREPFFELDDVEYTLPKKIPSSVTLRFLEELERGVSEAELMAWALDEIIGEGVYEALRGSVSVSNEELVWVMDQVGDRVMGELEKNQGKSRNGSRRSAGS